MISNKVAIILMVIFDIICCDKQVDECIKVFENMGLISTSGFYNFHFLLQFADFEEFVKHANTRINIGKNYVPKPPKPDKHIPILDTSAEASTSREPKRQKTDGSLPNEYSDYLFKLYLKARKSKVFEMFRNPFEYCTILVRTHSRVPETDRKQVHDRFISMIKNGGTLDSMDEREELLKKMDVYIEKCEKFILDYKFVFQNKVYNYDKNNVHRNILVSIQLALLNDNDQKPMDLKMKVEVEEFIIGVTDINSATTNHYLEDSIIGYFRYHITLFMDNYKNMPELTNLELCNSFVFTIERLSKAINKLTEKPKPKPVPIILE